MQIITLLSTPWIVKTLLFALLVGSLMRVIEKSKAIGALVYYLTQTTHLIHSKRGALFLTYIIGWIIFIESSITALITGAIAKSFAPKYHITREKVAYICDSTSAPVCSLILFNGWGALLLGLITSQIIAFNVHTTAIDFLLQSVLYNVYAYVSLLIVMYVIYFDITIGESYYATRDINLYSKGKIWPVLVPMFLVITLVFLFLYISGEGDILKGSGSSAILYSVVVTLLFTLVAYAYFHILPAQTWLKESYIGFKSMLPIALILLFAFVIGESTKLLETGKYIASFTQGNIAAEYMGAVIFVIAAIIAFATGTSWGTFSIMVPIAFSMGMSLEDVNVALLVGAVISGGVFGDHCSVISDTTVISSLASECDHIAHVRSQLPFALLGGAISVGIYIILGHVNV